ncbi:MAG: ABC-2 transporter permease [Lachnospiraceae bacterium]|nr:ABC-2 transporter permease [Lachnospiraceae bacterium]
MLGLIYRELRLTRKTLVTCLVLYLLFALLTDLFALSAQIGNLAKYCSPDELIEIAKLIPMAAMFGYIILLITAPEAIFQILDDDFKTTWLKYALSSPKTIREHVGAKYLTYLMMTVCSFVLGWIHVMIACGLSKQAIPDNTLLLFLVCALAVMMISSILLPIAYYVQNISFVNMLVTILFALVTLVYTIDVMFFFKQNEEAGIMDYMQYIIEKLTARSGTPLFHVLKILAPLIALLVIIGSFFLTVRILDKRRLVKSGSVSPVKKEGGKL